MSTTPTPALVAVAAAREAFVTASTASQAAHQQHSKLLVRLTEAKTQADEALSDFRAGKIDEATASLRKASAEADANDLLNLVNESAAKLAQVDAAMNAAKSREIKAEQDANREEHEMLARDLDRAIASAEKEFLALVARRSQVYIALHIAEHGKAPLQQSSTIQFYEPSNALKDLVKNYAAPPMPAPAVAA
ncbi:hypothetical protein ACFPTO_02215 [Paraburkholderia denitrificans]|uniref:Uncharacterized protein n=1 Tax=Paraburkholderia denitrificans TaxID=694025 RepID=A0ABW0J3N8_9BURK